MRVEVSDLAAFGLACALFGSSLSLYPARAADEVAEHPDFTGSWELNEERSDDLGEVVDEAMRGRAEPPRAGRGGPAASAPSDSRRALREQLEALVAAPSVLTIDQSERELTIESALPDKPYRQSVYTDGRAFARTGAVGEATAAWQRGGRLVLEYSLSGKRPVREVWELVAEGSRVLMAIEIAGKGLSPSVRIQRVYDRVEIVPWAVPD